MDTLNSTGISRCIFSSFWLVACIEIETLQQTKLHRQRQWLVHSIWLPVHQWNVHLLGIVHSSNYISMAWILACPVSCLTAVAAGRRRVGTPCCPAGNICRKSPRCTPQSWSQTSGTAAWRGYWPKRVEWRLFPCRSVGEKRTLPEKTSSLFSTT